MRKKWTHTALAFIKIDLLQCVQTDLLLKYQAWTLKREDDKKKEEEEEEEERKKEERQKEEIHKSDMIGMSCDKVK